MLRYLTLALCFVWASAALTADNKEQDRLENCGVVMQEILEPARLGGPGVEMNDEHSEQGKAAQDVQGKNAIAGNGALRGVWRDRGCYDDGRNAGRSGHSAGNLTAAARSPDSPRPARTDRSRRPRPPTGAGWSWR